MFLFEEKIEYLKKEIDDFKVSSPEDIAEYLKKDFNSPIEKFIVLFLNPQNCIMKQISLGTVDQCNVYPAQIAKSALLFNASRVVLNHSHPSGNLMPSSADKKITATIKNGLALFNIDIIDHVIHAPDGNFYSFQQDGIL